MEDGIVTCRNELAQWGRPEKKNPMCMNPHPPGACKRKRELDCNKVEGSESERALRTVL